MNFLLSPRTSSSNSGSPSLSSSTVGNSPGATGITGLTSRRDHSVSSQSTLRGEGENGELLSDETARGSREERDRKGKRREQPPPYDQDFEHVQQSMASDIETITAIPGAFRAPFNEPIGPTPLTQTTRLDQDTTFGVDIPRPDTTFDLSLDLDILRSPGARTVLSTEVSSGFGSSSGFSSASTPVVEESRGATAGDTTGPRSLPEPQPPKSVLKRRPDDVQSDWDGNATPGPSTRPDMRTTHDTHSPTSRRISSSHHRRSSRSESRRHRRDKSQERGLCELFKLLPTVTTPDLQTLARDFLLIIALCIGLASASILIVRPALSKFYGWDELYGSYDSDWEWAAEVEL